MKLRSTFLCGLSLLALATPAFAQQKVGTAGAVNPATSASLGGATRTVNMGSDVIFRERIVTSGSGSLQVTFVDKSTLSIGPNSQLVIDEFVYDPNTQSGKTAITLTRGAMRFVGGQISKSGNVAIKTPTATIGVRGGVAQILQTPQGTQVTNLFGRTTVTTIGGVEVISRPGFGIEIIDPNQPPGTPTRVAQAVLDAANKQLTSRTAQSGGSNKPPSDTTATQSGLGITNALTEPRNTIPQQQSSTSTNGPKVLSSAPPFLNQQPIVQNANAPTAAGQRPNPNVVPPPPPPPPPPPTAYQPRAYALVAAGTVPYLMGNFITSGAVVVTPAYGYRNGGEGKAGSRTRFGMAALSIDGQGAGQRSILAGATGTYSSDGTAEGSRFTGGFVAANRQSAGQGAGFASGRLTSSPGAITINNDGLPTQMVLTQNRYANGAIVPDQATQHLGDTSPTTSYGYQIPVAGGPAPSHVGVNRAGGAWQGYAAGTMQSVSIDASGNATPNGPASIVYGNTLLQFNPDQSTASGSITFVEALGGSIGALVGGLFQFGANPADPAAPTRSAYVDRNNWVMREQVSRNGGTVTGNSYALEYVPSESFTGGGDSARPSDPNRPNRMLLVPWNTFEAQDSATARGFFPTITQWRNYDYSQWGFWAGEMNYTSNDGSRQQLRTGNLNTWVAGQPTDIATMPISGSGTYTGHAVANIRNGSNEYIAGGDFSHTVDFGARTGAFAINNLDGRNYTGTSNFLANSVNFYGALSGGGASGTFDGSFYGPQAIETGGRFMFQSTGYVPYMGSGIFIGRR